MLTTRSTSSETEIAGWGHKSDRSMTATTATRPKKGEGLLSVLVVDDHPGILDLMVTILPFEDQVGQVLTARDGPEAIRICETFHPDVAFVDSFLPGMSGDEIRTELTKLHPEVLLVSLSGLPAEGVRTEMSLRKGSSTFLEDVRTVLEEAAERCASPPVEAMSTGRDVTS